MGLDKIKSKAVDLALVPTFAILPLTGCVTEKGRNKYCKVGKPVQKTLTK